MSPKGNYPSIPRCECKEPALWVSPEHRTETGLREVLIECDRCHSWAEVRYDPADVRRVIVLKAGKGPVGKPTRYVPGRD